MVDHAKVRRESMRWNLINTLNKARPYTSNEQFLLDVMRAIYPDVTALEVRRELDYLADRNLVALNKMPSGTWFADLTRYGVDIAREHRNAGHSRHQLIRDGLAELMVKELAFIGCELPADRVLELFQPDIEINAQGLGVWLDSESRRQ